jgi:hypothetical protein
MKQITGSEQICLRASKYAGSGVGPARQGPSAQNTRIGADSIMINTEHTIAQIDDSGRLIAAIAVLMTADRSVVSGAVRDGDRATIGRWERLSIELISACSAS